MGRLIFTCFQACAFGLVGTIIALVLIAIPTLTMRMSFPDAMCSPPLMKTLA